MMVDHPKPAWWRRALRQIVTFTFTLVVLAGASAAVLFGSAELASRAEATVVTEVADPTPVRVVTMGRSTGYDIPRRFVGQVEAAASVVLSFELSGRLNELHVDEGEKVAQGALLARLDTALLEADQDRLEASKAAIGAQLELAETRLTRAQNLQEGGHISQETADQALATRDELASRMRETDAAINAVAISLEKSELRAPFDGRVGLRNVDGGETLGAGAPVLTLIETAVPQVRVGLPLSVDASQLQTVSISVGRSTYPAQLAQVRPDIDPVTRTRTALFTLLTEDTPAFGQTATLSLSTRIDAAGSWVPLDALQEGAGGTWTVLLAEEDIVRLAMVEVLHADETRAYVNGTFAPGAQMIARGAHRVVPGQKVQILTTGE